MQTIAQNIVQVKTNIKQAQTRAGRAGPAATLIVVTKYADAEQINQAVAAGAVDLGESRVQRLQDIARQVTAHNPGKQLKWHMIGHLQRNKVRKAVGIAACIHSVDTLRLAEEISSAAQKLKIVQNVMLQVNTSNEPQKYGVPVGAAIHLAEQMATMPNIRLTGLMTMAPLTDEQSRIRACFARAYELFMEIKGEALSPYFEHLSMGMSNDYQIAVEEGATMVRVGSAIFGK